MRLNNKRILLFILIGSSMMIHAIQYRWMLPDFPSPDLEMSLGDLKTGF